MSFDMRGAQEEAMINDFLIAVLREEIVRQSEGDDSPWIDIDYSPTVIRIDGELDLQALAAAVRAALSLQTPDAEKGEKR